MGKIADKYVGYMMDAIIGGENDLFPATIYFGLSTTSPADDGQSQTELSGSGYARSGVANTPANFPASGVDRIKANGVMIAFPPASANWNGGLSIGFFTMWDDPTSTLEANFVGWGAITAPVTVLSGQQASFAIGSLTITAPGT